MLSTTPLSGVATGDGWDQRHSGLVHFKPNLHNVGDWGRSGATNPVRVEGCVVVVVAAAPAEDVAVTEGVAWMGAGATTAGAVDFGLDAGAWSAAEDISEA